MTNAVCVDRLNEGHTVFIERKIAGRMFGEQLRHFLALDGWTELKNQVCNSVVSAQLYCSFVFWAFVYL